MIQGNVIHVEPETFYCMRQCQEMVKHLSAQKDDQYKTEIAGETELYKIFMKEVMQRAA